MPAEPREVQPRRWVNPRCMTPGDHEGHERDQQMGRLGLPMFHVEQPGVAVFYTSPCEPMPVPVETGREGRPDMIQGMQAKALSEALAALREAERSAMGVMTRAQEERAAQIIASMRATVAKLVGNTCLSKASEWPFPEDANLKAQHEAAAAHARSMGEAHQQRMLDLQAQAHACVGMQQGDSGWRDWNDG